MAGLKRRRAEEGFILLDVLVALFIVLIGFSVCLGGMSTAGRLVRTQEARVRSMIEQRNEDARDFTVVFHGE